ncbi:sigma 54-interacting transcriptional regulator [Hydrogenivirga sp.]
MDFRGLSNLFDGVLVINRERRIIFANKKAESILGRKLKPGDTCRGLFSICDSCPMELVEDTEEGVQVYDVRTLKGAHVCLSMTPNYENGEFSGVIEIFRDVSRVIHHMEEVKRQKEFVQVVLDSIVEAVLVFDNKGRVIEHNSMAKRILCRELDSIKGESIENLINLSLEDLPPEGERGDVYIETPCGRQKASVLVSRLKEGAGYVISFYVVPELLSPSKHEFQIVSKSPEFTKVLDRIRSIAEMNVNVLITGETGTGKSLIARYIHLISPRREQPFVKINCGALPENLLEAELFGYNKGAFTGAIKDKPGKVEVADGGTLFLDEIGDLPLHLQVKILNLIQEKEFERIGDVKPRRVDVRIIAATNRNLRKLVREEKFREDLYYRLNVVSIELPPLRERKEDIPLLVNHFISKFSQEHGRHIKGISPSAMKILLGYDFPGNIRELENAIESAVVVCRGTIIDVEDLPEEIKHRKIVENRGGHDDEAERIRRVLYECGGNKSLAARVLGMHRTTLWRKLKELGIG